MLDHVSSRHYGMGIQQSGTSSMNVLGLTIFVSLALVIFFIGAFLYHHDFSGGDPLRDSLLPFGREKIRDQKNGEPTPCNKTDLKDS